MNSKPNFAMHARALAASGKVSASVSTTAATTATTNAPTIGKVNANSNDNNNDADEHDNSGDGAAANDYVDRANSAHQLATLASGSNNSRASIGSSSRYDQLQRQQVVFGEATVVGSASLELTWQDDDDGGEGEFLEKEEAPIATETSRTTNKELTSAAVDGQHRQQQQQQQRQVSNASARASASASASAVPQINYCTAVDNYQSSSSNNNNNNKRADRIKQELFNNRLENWNAVTAGALEACSGPSKSEYSNICGGSNAANRGKAARGQTDALGAEITNEFNCRFGDSSSININNKNSNSNSISGQEQDETCVDFNQQQQQQQPSSSGCGVAFNQAASGAEASELQQQKRARELELKLAQKSAYQEAVAPTQRQTFQIKQSNYDQIVANKCATTSGYISAAAATEAFNNNSHQLQYQRRHPCQYQHSDSIDLSAADTFWRKLSNLSRSITQRQQQLQLQSQQPTHEHHQAISGATTTAVGAAGLSSLPSSSSIGQLAPEVVGYLAKNSIISGQQQHCGADNEWQQRQQVNSTGDALCPLPSINQCALDQAAPTKAAAVADSLIGARSGKLDTRNIGQREQNEAKQQQQQRQQQLNTAQAYREGKGGSEQICASSSVPSFTNQSVSGRQASKMTTTGTNQSEPVVGPSLAMEDQQQQQQCRKFQPRDNCVDSGGNEEKLIKIVKRPAPIKIEPTPSAQPSARAAPPADGDIGPDQKRHQSQSQNLSQNLTRAQVGGGDIKQQNQVKLSITTSMTASTNTTATATRSTSGASSLSSCIISDSTSVNSEVRLKWGKKMDFLLSIIGFAVDLANIWRFPYLVYKNGGGVFLIPYSIMLIFGGIPLFFLELCLGQFVKKGPITVWNKICPYMKGVGYCSILISWYVSFYYNILIAWSVYFIYRSILSFGQKMPWEECDNPWNNKTTCLSISQLKQACSTRNQTLAACREELYSSRGHIVTSPASEFFVSELSQIDQSKGLEDMGYLRLEIVVCAIIVYLLHYFSLFRGLETSGKVVWVTATAPYMILSILLIRGLFLPGASLGIEYYLSPRLEKLAEPQVWIDAAGQVFYSIGVGFGVHLTYASFNSHTNNCYRDCLMTSAVNAATSVYSGLVVFVYLGYMATNLGIEIDKVASEGYSLVFEVYPEAMTTLPFARFWSILFFIMLLTLGIDSAMGGLEAVITGLEDEFKFAKRLSRSQLTALVILSSFLPSLISCTQGGAYTLFWFDIYSAGVSLLFSALFETIGVVYCYGLDKFILNIESMLGRKPQFFYIICWKYISPIFLMGIIFMSIYTASTPVYRNYTFPLWSVVLGWCLAFSSVAAIPIVAICTWCTNGTKTISVSPSKSPRKPGYAGGSYSTTRGAGGAGIGDGSRNSVTRKSPASQNQCKSISVNYSGSRGVQLGLIGGFDGGQMTTTTNVIAAPIEHCNRGSLRIKEDML